MKSIHIGIIGFGTVGAGVAETLLNNGDIIAKRTGYHAVLKRIADLDTVTDRGVKLPEGMLVSDAMQIIDDPEIDVVVELIGGTTIAATFIQKALERGKHVVTANKALLATQGKKLFAIAREHHVDIAFEASVGGGIPCLKALREGLAANRIKCILGILNGTCNYILTRMESERTDFEVILKAAQEAGYAEANPSLDVDGFDTAHKAAILASLAYGHWFTASDVLTQGIRNVTLDDIQFAADMGFRIKLLAVIKELNGRVQLQVRPSLVPVTSLLGNVNGVFNAVWIQGDVVGNTMYYGRGAGRQATASAVVADILDAGFHILDHSPARPLGIDDDDAMETVSPDESYSRHYIRLQIADRPGVLAKVSGVLGDCGISISTATQKEAQAAYTQMILITHQGCESAVRKVMEILDTLSEVHEKPVVFCIETLE